MLLEIDLKIETIVMSRLPFSLPGQSVGQSTTRLVQGSSTTQMQSQAIGASSVSNSELVKDTRDTSSDMEI